MLLLYMPGLGSSRQNLTQAALQIPKSSHAANIIAADMPTMRSLAWVLGFAAACAAHNRSCTTGAIPKPKLFGARILSFTAHEELNRSISATHFNGHWDLSYCSVNMYDGTSPACLTSH